MQDLKKKKVGKRGSKKEKKRNHSSTKRREAKKDAIKNVWKKKKKKKIPTDFRRTNQFHAGEAFHYFSFFPPEIERGRIHKSDLNH